MTQKSVLTNHELHRTLDSITPLFDKPELLEKLKFLNPEQRAAIIRGRLFTQQVKAQLSSYSDSEVIIALLGTVQAGIQNSINELNSFITNGNPGHIDNYSSHLDGAIQQSSNAFFVRRVKGERRYGESVESVEKAAVSAISNIQKDHDLVLARLDEAKAQIASQVEATGETRARADAKIQETSDAIRAFSEKFDVLSGEQRKELREHLESQRSDFSAQIDEFRKSAEGEVTKLSSLEDEARKIVQIIGNIGVTGNYQNRAGSEESQANIWRIITLILFGVGIALVIANLILNFNGQIGLDLLLVRFAIAVSIALPAFYTARESARHRSNADRAKQTELELASLGPYLQTLPTDSKDQVIVELSKLYFGRATTDHTVDSPVDIQKMVETISKIALTKVGA